VIPLWLLGEVSGFGRLDEDPDLAALAEADLLFPSAAGMLRFKHGLTRNVIYEAIGRDERRGLHDRVAAALAGHAAGQAAAADGAAASPLGGGRGLAEAAARADVAGDRAAAVSALDRAKTLYRNALDWYDEGEPAAGDGARWLGIANKLG